MTRFLSIFVAVIVCLNVSAGVYEVRLTDSDARNKYINVTIDGQTELFAFDTGCSGLSVNRRVINKLLREGKLAKSDFRDETDAQMSNGMTHLMRKFVVRELTIGGYTFHNVVAHVGVNDVEDAPLLLGQSVLERLRWYRIEGNKLCFEPLDEDLQQAIFYSDYYSADTASYRETARLLLPYERENRLTCFYRQKLLSALYNTAQYEAALSLLGKLQADDCITDTDYVERELWAKYGLAVDLYNEDKYAESEVLAREVWERIKKEPSAKHKNLKQYLGELLYFICKANDDIQGMQEFLSFRRK